LPTDIYVDSNGKTYLILRGTTYQYFYTGYPISSTDWEFVETLETTDGGGIGTNVENNHYTSDWASRQYMIHKNSAGWYILEGVVDRPGFVVYDNDWDLLGRLTSDLIWPYGSLTICGVSWRSTNENVFYACGGSGEQEGLVEIIPVWDGMFDASMTPIGTVADIVSNYIDLGISEDKRVCGVSLDTVSVYPTVGKFALESNYNINNALRVDDEAAEVDGSVSRLTFGHPGEKTWNTTSTFDSTVEQWRTHEIGVGLSGQSFRYSIKLGDIVGGGHGLARIRPPKIEVQIKVKPSDEHGGR